MKIRNIIISPIIALALLLNGCGTNGINITITNPEITTFVSIATAATFKYAITDTTKRTTIAKYVSGIAGGVRALTGKETPDQVAAALAANIPANVLAQFPEIATIVIPQVVGYYQDAQTSFGTNVQGFLDRMNSVATGLEQGVAAYTNG